MPAQARTGVLLLQLGTPDAPTPAAVRRYLAEFLSDRRVVDLPRLQWWPVLHGIVLRTRPRRSAALYAKIWTDEGSPLAVISAAQAAALSARLSDGSPADPIPVEVAMRYGAPAIPAALARLRAAGIDRVLALPMYPQYSSATTGSSLQALYLAAARQRVVPSLRVVPPYPEDEGYISALAASAREALNGVDVDHLVLSFHGIPERYARLGDPYPDQCQATAARLVQALGWPAGRVSTAFQSRFGREVWLQPYTDATLRALARGGVRRVAVMCPGFPADCLETLEEIAITNRELFLESGGEVYHFVPGLNTRQGWIEALAAIARRELSGWSFDLPGESRGM